MNKLPLSLIVFFMITVALAVAGFWYVSSTSTIQQNAVQRSSPATQVEAELLQVNATLEDYWAWIKLSNMEPTCLEKVKEAAGSNGWTVRTCTCKEEVDFQWKNYTCVIDTVLGDRSLSANCMLGLGRCTLESEGQRAEYTFEELASVVR